MFKIQEPYRIVYFVTADFVHSNRAQTKAGIDKMLAMLYRLHIHEIHVHQFHPTSSSHYFKTIARI